MALKTTTRQTNGRSLDDFLPSGASICPARPVPAALVQKSPDHLALNAGISLGSRPTIACQAIDGESRWPRSRTTIA